MMSSSVPLSPAKLKVEAVVQPVTEQMPLSKTWWLRTELEWKCCQSKGSIFAFEKRQLAYAYLEA